jgi:hypothetical protein
LRFFALLASGGHLFELTAKAPGAQRISKCLAEMMLKKSNKFRMKYHEPGLPGINVSQAGRIFHATCLLAEVFDCYLDGRGAVNGAKGKKKMRVAVSA